MAAIGFIPWVAIPPQNVTACSSAMPTSNVRSGCTLANLSRPVPSGIAAVMATIFGSRLASSINVSAKTAV